LILCLGKATKALQYVVEYTKEYEAVMKLGETTDSQDLTGSVLEQRSVPDFAPAELEDAVSSFVGDISQTPPMYSARKVNGQRLYTLARAGKTVEREIRTVTIDSLEITEVALPSVSFRVICSKGTYIRTLANDLGETLGCGAHLTQLRRTQIGRFGIDEACSLEQLADTSPGREREQALLPIDKALNCFPALTLNEEDATRLIHGVQLYHPQATLGQAARADEAEQILRIYNSSGEFLALARRTLVPHQEGFYRQIRPIKVFFG
ncbi:MAG: tRNA pseudouridine(55) synthase TruB, partial [bacterium]|nr:tRNA pseudouridine(55) synthase TruB [bacterium]